MKRPVVLRSTMDRVLDDERARQDAALATIRRRLLKMLPPHYFTNEPSSVHVIISALAEEVAGLRADLARLLARGAKWE